MVCNNGESMAKKITTIYSFILYSKIGSNAMKRIQYLYFILFSLVSDTSFHIIIIYLKQSMNRKKEIWHEIHKINLHGKLYNVHNREKYSIKLDQIGRRSSLKF